MAQIHGVNLATFSVKQLDDIIQEAEKQKGATQAATTIAVMAAWKAAHKWLMENAPDDLGESFKAIPQQAGPRESNIMKKYDMSETQRDASIEKGRKAIASL